jgi:uncharacterized membrane protein YhaH (DUF805 family)
MNVVMSVVMAIRVVVRRLADTGLLMWLLFRQSVNIY